MKSASADFRAVAAGSLVSAQVPQRMEFLDRMAEGREIPSVGDLEKLWFTLQEEMTEGGKVARFQTEILDRDGAPKKTEVVRVGTFTAMSGGEYLALEGGRLATLAEQPKSEYLSLADAMGKTRFVSMQNHYNLVYREEEREMMPLCRDQGIGVIPWSPLARGFLAGNRRRQDKGETTRAKSDEFAHMMYYNDSDFDIVERVTEIARKRGVSNAQVALAWLMQQKGVTAPIVGASKPQHLQDAIAAASLKLDEAELKALSEHYKPHPVLGHR